MEQHIKIVGCCGVCANMGVGAGTLECYADDDNTKSVRNIHTCDNFKISTHMMDLSALVCTYPLANAGKCVNDNKVSMRCIGETACHYLTKRVSSGE